MLQCECRRDPDGSEYTCKICEARWDHARGCRSFSAGLDQIGLDAKCNGLLMAKAIVLQAAVNAETPELRDFAERIADQITGVAYGLAL